MNLLVICITLLVVALVHVLVNGAWTLAINTADVVGDVWVVLN